MAALIASSLALSGVADAGVSGFGSPLPESEFVGAMTAGPDGSVWFSASVDGFGGVAREVGEVTPGGAVTQYSVPAGADSITTGTDGNVWFAETHGIGRMARAGEAVSFGLPEGSGTPVAVSAGPDGNVWFVTDKPDAVGRISPTGSVTMSPLPGEGGPSAITAGPSGDLWFTEPMDARIGRITITGEVREFQLAKGARPNSIVLGSDGSLWFSDLSQARVGRITPSGEVTFFPVPTIDGTGEVAAGPGGLIWFAAGNEIGTITTAGRVTWPSCFSRGCEYPPAAMTMGPDGSLWVASGVGHCPSYCGGGSEQAYLRGSSGIGPFTLPSVELGIGPALTPLRHGRTKVTVGCGDAHACDGTLRLRALLKLPGARFVTPVISVAPYSLAAGQIQEVAIPLRLSRWQELRHGRDFVVIDAVEGEARVARRGFYFSPGSGGSAKQS